MENANDSTGTIRILLNDDTSYEAPCSEEEYLAAMESLGWDLVESRLFSFSPYDPYEVKQERVAPAGMRTLAFNGSRNAISLYHSDIKRIYWESNI